MRHILALILLAAFCIPAQADEPNLTVYALGNNRCEGCGEFSLFVGRFYDETKWAKIAKLERVTIDQRTPQLIPSWYKEAFLDGRTSKPGHLPMFMIWAKTTKYPEKGREIGRFYGFEGGAGEWYINLELMLDAITTRMKDGVFQE